MSRRPYIVDAEFEVITPRRQVPIEYEAPDSIVRRGLAWANRATAIPGDRTNDFLQSSPTWRLAVWLIINLATWAVVAGLVVGLAYAGQWFLRSVA